jgi:uroporphyrinogen-III decarboxylase
MPETVYEQRIRIANEAIRHEEPERVPIWINYGTTPFMLSDDGTTYRDALYNHEAASKAIIKFHMDFQPDVQLSQLLSGKAEEIAGTRYIDWPGRPGTALPNDSIFQVHEYEFLKEDEYKELLSDFTGFMLHKYIPRAFPGLEGMSTVLNPVPCGMMYFGQLGNMFSPKAVEAYEKLIEIGKLQAETQKATYAIMGQLTHLGFPPMLTGVGLVPFDLLSNYFRGTVAMFEDLIECPDMVEKAVNMFADLQIANLQYLRFAPLPVKRVMFWMHKGMDGFISPRQFDDLYWKPFLKVIYALVDMGVTPIIYTEGNYYKRIDQMKDLPAGKCVIHFENVDLEYAKKTIGVENCITCNFPIYLLERGTKEEVIKEAKREIDICAPGGGFIFETNASIMGVKRENLEALYDTVREYGRK